MPEKPKTLAEFTRPHMVLTCMQCGRKGRYNVARLIEMHGPDMPIRDFIDQIGQSCHRWVNPTKWQRCGLGCNDLVHMFTPPPATEAFATMQNDKYTLDELRRRASEAIHKERL